MQYVLILAQSEPEPGGLVAYVLAAVGSVGGVVGLMAARLRLSKLHYDSVKRVLGNAHRQGITARANRAPAPSSFGAVLAARLEETLAIRNAEIHALFVANRLWTVLAGLVGTFAAVVFIYGAFLAASGGMAVGVVTALVSALPGFLSKVLFDQARRAEDRAMEALAEINREIRRIDAICGVEWMASLASSSEMRDRLYGLAAILTAQPDLEPEHVSRLLIQATGGGFVLDPVLAEGSRLLEADPVAHRDVLRFMEQPTRPRLDDGV
jgi:ABC-type multidrug transport system fused ATPase/permease subunit